MAVKKINCCRAIKKLTGFKIGKVKDSLDYKDKGVESFMGDEKSKGFVYDLENYNFHMYPKNIVKKEVKSNMDSIARKIRNKREKIIEYIKKNKKEIKIFEDIDEYYDAINRNGIKRNDLCFIESLGSKGNIMPSPFKQASPIFKFLCFYKNGICYNLNFMRFYTSGEKDDKCINVDLCSFQYDSFNKNHPFPSDDKDGSENENRNVYKNSEVNFDDSPEAIIEDFMRFIK